MTVKLVTITGVELAAVGDWPVERGYGRFTAEDLDSMVVEAAAGLNPRLKIGHAKTGIGALPAWGQVTNLRVDETSGKLLGDYVNVPEKLAAILPTALPGRSLEAVRNRVRSDGSKAPMVMTAVALLGAQEPAMNTLADHTAIDGIHDVVTGADDLLVAAARALDDLDETDLLTLLGDGRDSMGRTTTEDGTVPDDNPTLHDDAKAQADAKAAEEQKAKDAADAAAKAEAEAAQKAKDEAEAAEKAAQDKNKPSEDPKVVQVDATVWQQTLDRVAQLEAAQEEQVAAARDSFLDDALAAGKITPDSREAWATAMAATPDATRKLIEGLPATIPTEAARGHEGDPSTMTSDVEAAYEARYGKTEA